MAEAIPVAVPPDAGSSRGRGRNNHRRRGRGGAMQQHARDSTVNVQTPNQPARDASLAFRPASVTPGRASAPNSVSSRAGLSRVEGHRPRGGRGGRVRGGPAGIYSAGGRAFGGNLTSDQASTASGAGPQNGLQGDAPTFTPGQQMVPRSLPNVVHTKQRRMSKSQAPDIATRTHEDIANGLYECPICTSEVMSNSKIWSCKTCWTVFHMSCIKKWSKNEGSTQQRAPNQSGEMPPPRQWRCPGCNLPKDDLPSTYTCWCAKEIDPKSIPGLPPHSCGQTCSKPRAPRKCPHPCELLCHAGPCPPCPHMGPKQGCFCGKEVAAKRCLDTDYDNGWSCGQVCGDMMACGEHFCERPCHEGFCGGCEVVVESICYCGKSHESLPCADRGEVLISTLPDAEAGKKIWEGSFECDDLCRRLYDCGKHFCEKKCHPQSLAEAHCPFSPDVVNTCPCGKTSLNALDCHRSSCEEPIPHCQQTCQKKLPCGHSCSERCHKGACPPCLETVEIKCRCGRTSQIGTCLESQGDLPQCERHCKVPLNCGRHECRNECCPAEKAAIQRRKKRAMVSTLPSPVEDFEAEHICTKTCGRQLKCGNLDHVCPELCHSGPCGGCREAIFEDITCHCGRTVLQPPLPCGTQPPPCQFQCNRQKPCGHPQVPHQCHMEEICPKCPYLMQKPCMCGKAKLKNQPCWSTQVNCGQNCGRRLKCGLHFCTKTCHRPGECEDANLSACPQICSQPKTIAGCGHPCLDRCHAPYPCKQDKPCTAKIMITCECQNLKKETKCMASKTEEGNTNKSLSCDEDCARLQRNAKLAQALNIPSDHLDDHIPYSNVTLDMFRDHSKWCQTQEREFRVFAADTEEKRLRFKPMDRSKRAFLHSLAEDFGLDSESMDPEPHRHVTIFKSPRFVSAPMKTLGQCAKIRAQPEVAKPADIIKAVKAFNGLLLTAPRFALTVDELRAAIDQDLKVVKLPSIIINFLPSEEIVLTIASPAGLDVEDETTEPLLTKLKVLVNKTIKSQDLAASVLLCRVDCSLNVLRKEESSSAGGWSQVVKGASATRIRGPDLGNVRKNAFTVLGRGGSSGANGVSSVQLQKEKAPKQTLAWRKKEEVKVVDDWEADVEGWDVVDVAEAKEQVDAAVENAPKSMEAAFDRLEAETVQHESTTAPVQVDEVVDATGGEQQAAASMTDEAIAAA